MYKENKTTRPDHYTRFEYEPYKVIEDWGLGFNLGNVLKYIARAGHKDGVDAREDLLKAKQYLEFELGKQKSSEPGDDVKSYGNKYNIISSCSGINQYGFSMIYKIGRYNMPVEYELKKYSNDDNFYLSPVHSVMCWSALTFSSMGAALAYLNQEKGEVLPDE